MLATRLVIQVSFFSSNEALQRMLCVQQGIRVRYVLQ